MFPGLIIIIFKKNNNNNLKEKNLSLSLSFGILESEGTQNQFKSLANELKERREKKEPLESFK